MSSTLLQLLLCQELVELVRTKKLAQAAAASAKKNWLCDKVDLTLLSLMRRYLE